MTTSIRAIVTGHSRGIGAAVAEHCLDRGIAVMGIARHGNADLAKRFGATLREVSLDLGDSDAIVQWVEGGALRQFLDGASTALLVNNAGVIQPIGPLEAQDAAAVARAVTVNVSAPLMLSSAFARDTARTKDRRILHISSGAGRKAYAGWSVYDASKAALDHHARTVAVDRSPRLRISAVAPGTIDTEMQTELRASTDALFPDRPRFVKLKREGGLLDPLEVGAKLVDFLLSPQFGDEPVSDLRDFPTVTHRGV